MHFNGLKIQILSFAAFLIVANVSAEDFGIAMPDQLKGEEQLLEQLEKDEKGDDVNFVMGDRDEDLKVEGNNTEVGGKFSLQDQVQEANYELSRKEKILSTGNEVPFTHEKKEFLIEFKNNDIYKKIYNTGESAFSFSYIQDTYDVTDTNNVFQDSFVNATGSKRGGTLHLQFDEYFSRGFLKMVSSGL